MLAANSSRDHSISASPIAAASQNREPTHRAINYGPGESFNTLPTKDLFTRMLELQLQIVEEERGNSANLS